MGKRVGVVLLGFVGVALALPGAARAADHAAPSDVQPGTLVQALPGGRMWQACGAPELAPCTGPRAIVWVLASAQVLTQDRQEAKKLRLLVEDQQRKIDLLTSRLEFAHELKKKTDDQLRIASDVLKMTGAHVKELSARTGAAEAKLADARLRWFSIGAATVFVIAGGCIAAVTLL